MNKATGFKRIINATGYSIKGFKAAWKNEAAFRQECALLLVAVILAYLINVTVVERILLIGSVVLIVLTELLNSAIEATVDRIGSEKHELSGRAKDIGSAAVLVAILLALFVWIFIGINAF